MAWSKSTRISVMLAIDAVFFVVELGVGLAVGSLALMADAFHMLNDIISLVVGLWAVKAAQRASSDKYSFGWLRAEILGAFFNAVFLIALCLSIVLEAITRLIDPPVIGNAQLILIVGSFGLASNLAGFFVLGGHGHSHGPEEHDHGDGLREAEEGHNHTESSTEAQDTGSVGEFYPEAVVARAQLVSSPPKRAVKSEDSLGRSASKASHRKNRRRASSGRAGRFESIDDISIYPATKRQEIIAASKPQLDGIESDENTASDEEATLDGAMDVDTERTHLLAGPNSQRNGHGTIHPEDPHPKLTSDACHDNHNHNKPKKQSSGGHGHSHDDMGMNAMILHVIGDALGNIGVIVSALIIWLTDWSGRFYADPAVSLFITLIILKSTIPLTSATAKILLQATPDHIDVNDIKEDIQAIPGVISCHHVHIWQLSDTQIVASMHIQVAFAISEASGEKYMDLARAARKCLHAYGIHSATIQPEFCLDRSHDHIESSVGNLDGASGQPRCGLDDDLCLLSCVDNCQGKGCCSAPKSASSQHSHEEQDGHSHDGHSHEGHHH